MTELQATKRETVSKKENLRLRSEGKIPAVLYGPKEEATPIAIEGRDFAKAFSEAGESTVITLQGLGDDKDVLIHEVAIDPVRQTPVHVDFYAIEKGKKVQVHVPLTFAGTSPVERELGGTLIKVLHEIEIEAFPKDLPHEIEVDIAFMKDLESVMTVGDLAMPAGVTAITPAEEVVMSAAEAVEYVEEAPAEAVDMSAIEVEKRGKEEEEESAE